MKGPFRPSRREVLASAALVPAVAATAPLARDDPRPRALLWVEAAGSPAACDLLDPSLAPARFETRMAQDGWGGARRALTASPSPFAPCGGITDALPRLASAGAIGTLAPDPAALWPRILAWLGQAPPTASACGLEPVAAGAERLARGERFVRVLDRTPWGQLRHLPAHAARLDGDLAHCRERSGLGEALLIVVAGTHGRAPTSRLPWRRDPIPGAAVLVAQGVGAARALAV
ncbi:MAG: hypothetical protein AAFZ65_00705 [Planctomycetota bacterium]